MTVEIFSRTTDAALAGRIERAAHMVYLDGAREAEVCAALTIRKGTLRDWKKRPEWAEAVSELRDQQRRLARDRLAALTTRAVDALVETLETGSEANRLKAAIWILERGGQMLEGADASPPAAGRIEQFVRIVAGGSGDEA